MASNALTHMGPPDSLSTGATGRPAHNRLQQSDLRLEAVGIEVQADAATFNVGGDAFSNNNNPIAVANNFFGQTTHRLGIMQYEICASRLQAIISLIATLWLNERLEQVNGSSNRKNSVDECLEKCDFLNASGHLVLERRS